MKILSAFFLFFATISLSAQVKMEMTPAGFAPVEFKSPNRPTEKLIEAVKGWASTYNRKGYDVYDVTENSVSVDAIREFAYFYRNLGERYDYNIRYTLKINFREDKTYTVTFSVKESYAKQTLVQTTIADFFTPDGKLKDDYIDVKPSLEHTAGKIVKSLSDFLAR